MLRESASAGATDHWSFFLHINNIPRRTGYYLATMSRGRAKNGSPWLGEALRIACIWGWRSGEGSCGEQGPSSVEALSWDH